MLKPFDSYETGQPCVRPQHEPGPAHPASAGRLPQQPWSRGPGMFRRPLPVKVLVGDISFSG
jgi:hypothetical protein